MLPSLWAPNRQPRLQFQFIPSLPPSTFYFPSSTLSVGHLCHCFGCLYCFSFLFHVSGCCLLIPQAGAARLECIILIGPGEGVRLVGLLSGLRGGVSTEIWSIISDNQCSYRDKRLSTVEKGISLPTKQPTKLTGHLIFLTTTRNFPLSGITLH